MSHSAEKGAPLALHVRRHRQACRRGELTQAQLAAASGISEGRIRTLERARTLPPAVEALVDLALTLEVPIENLIAPAAVAERADRLLERHAAAKENENAAVI